MIKRYQRKKICSAYCFNVVRDDVLWPNGKRSERELLIHPGISVMLPLLGRNQIILVRQYRYGADRELWELPAGTLAKGEEPLPCAKREMEEEIGYRARAWSKLASCYVSPAFSTEIMHLFLARNLFETQTRREEYEVMKSQTFKISEVRSMLHHRKIRDAKTLIGFFYFFGRK